ncbi:MAG: hypothetical protein ACHREM_01430 [Polyangiales bacterium]
MVNPAPSKASSTSTSTSNKSGTVETPKVVDAVKQPTDGPVVDPAKPQADDKPAASGAEKPETTIVSITVSTRLASKARLLARIRGVTISSLFTDAAAREIPVALKAALADMRDEDIE